MNKKLIGMNKKTPAPSDGTDVVLRRKELGTDEGVSAETTCGLCRAKRKKRPRSGINWEWRIEKGELGTGVSLVITRLPLSLSLSLRKSRAKASKPAMYALALWHTCIR